MKMLFHGIDLVECSRIEKMLSKHGDHFTTKIYTEAELAYANKHRNPVERLAGRFAVKEAVLKMIGTGLREKINWTDVETINNVDGQPQINLYNRAKELTEQLGIDQISVSITHAAGLAIASAVALSK
ncbi:MAG: holo-ACP synthase [Phycisphaerae bacterium]|nr:holo-ACP synthase [Phycisphaerae bacterium]